MARRHVPRTNLGPALEPLLGREEECAAVLSRLHEGARVVTVTGPGGIGKSSVGREIGRRIAGNGEGGEHAAGLARRPVVLCELADVTGLEGLLLAVARAASVPGAGASSRGKQAAVALAKRLAAAAPLALVLDDADGVIADAATFVRACLDASAELCFVVTSREALGLEGERVTALGPLGLDAAVSLFESRAGGGGWTKEQVATLVEHLDGLPLGIELAARRSRLVPPSDLLDRLQERFRLLKSDRRDVAARHATLSATIEWSLARLDRDEARAFAALGAFDGSFAVEAFEAVVGPLLAGDPVDAAESLLRKSLVVAVESQGAARLTMLQTLRAFARERLGAVQVIDAAERDATELRHATYYVQRAEAAAARAYGAGAEDALDAIEVDLPNVLHAFERMRARHPALAARVVAAIGDVVVLRNAVSLRSPLFAEARAAADADGDAALRARVRVVEAKAKLEIAGAAEAEALLVQALAIAEAGSFGTRRALLGDAADVRRSLAWARIALGQAESALVLLEEALAVHRAQKNRRGEADALAARGLTRCLRGDVAGGHGDLENAYALHVLAGDEIRREKVQEMAAVVGLDLEGEIGGRELGAGEGSEGERGRGDDGGRQRDAASVEERVARLRAAVEAHRASGRVWREAVARFQLAKLERSSAAQVGRVAGVIGGAGEAGSTSDGGSGAACGWRVGLEARAVTLPSGEPLDLARHGSLRRVLDALVTKRLEEPGAASSAVALLASGWPGEKVRHESGMLRVYSVIRRLRALGLGDALMTRDDGYLLDPNVRFERIG